MIGAGLAHRLLITVVPVVLFATLSMAGCMIQTASSMHGASPLPPAMHAIVFTHLALLLQLPCKP